MLPGADVHTPGELLAAAEDLLSREDSFGPRAAVLEAMTALESEVHRSLFGVLEQTVHKAVRKCLEKKTQTDFDTRVGILLPAATGLVIDKNGALRRRLRDAREIRNRVTHGGRRVTAAEASEVVETVREWLSLLGSTADVHRVLLRLRDHAKRRQVFVNSPEDATQVIRRYFEKRGPTLNLPLVGGAGRHVVLRFGERQVIVYGAFHPFSSQSLMALVDETINQEVEITWDGETPRTVVVVFRDDPKARDMRPLTILREDLAAVVVPLSS